jgi:hypothetical protein
MSKVSWHYISRPRRYHWSFCKVGRIATPVARTACEACAVRWLRNRKRLALEGGFDLLQSIQPANDLFPFPLQIGSFQALSSSFGIPVLV